MVRPKPKIWPIENVDLETRRKIKAHADLNGIKIAEALKRLVDIALANDPSK